MVWHGCPPFFSTAKWLGCPFAFLLFATLLCFIISEQCTRGVHGRVQDVCYVVYVICVMKCIRYLFISYMCIFSSCVRSRSPSGFAPHLPVQTLAAKTSNLKSKFACKQARFSLHIIQDFGSFVCTTMLIVVFLSFCLMGQYERFILKF